MSKTEIPLDRLYIEAIHRRIERLFPVKLTPYSDEEITEYGRAYKQLNVESPIEPMGFALAKQEIEYYQNKSLEWQKGNDSN